jgi:dsDNA-specific endonuclease/ATPase MutS2
MSDQSALTTTSNKFYSSIQSFESAQRIAASLADSALVPNAYRGQQGLPNCIVAIEIANRMGMSPFQVMQNLNVIHGRPSWSSQFIIGLIQGCGRFEGFTYTETADSCQCFAALKTTGEQVSGPKITLEMAKREGWTKNTKWSTMPQTMLRYRAASAFGRFHIPDLILGIQSVEENEVIDAEVTVAPEPAESKLDKVAEILAPKTEPQHVPDIEPTAVVEVDDFFD